MQVQETQKEYLPYSGEPIEGLVIQGVMNCLGNTSKPWAVGGHNTTWGSLNIAVTRGKVAEL